MYDLLIKFSHVIIPNCRYMNMRKKISISISKDVMEQIKLLAEQSNMSVSRYIETVLLQDIQEHDTHESL